MKNKLWKQAISIEGLEAGWHLTRTELRRGFIVDYLSSDAFGNALRPNLVELRRKLEAESFHPRPLIEIALPKGSLGTRPGSYIPIEDRVVLWSIIKVIAPIISESISENVYSCKLKDDVSDGLLFEDTKLSDILHYAYLKGSIIKKYIDPFEQWYEAWPEFESRSEEIIEQGYNFLSISDISAYFENISLPILRDMLLSSLRDEQKIVNHILKCLELWAVSTHEGFRPHRGIPQGSSISSFLGNLYLTGIDNIFLEFAGKHDIKYIRYMDDIRIFSNDVTVARNVIFTLEDAVRKFHLNLQSAKTLIVSEADQKGITNYIYDPRLEKLNKLSGRLDAAQNEADIKAVIDDCYGIAREPPSNHKTQRVLPIPNKLDTLTSRVSRRMMGLLVQAGDDKCGKYLFEYISKNIDFRFMHSFSNYIKINPKKSGFQSRIIDFIESDECFFPHQEAELIGVLRHFSRLTPETREYLASRLTTMNKEYFYIQMQLCRIAPRLYLDGKTIRGINKGLINTTSDEVFISKSFVLSSEHGLDIDEIISRYESVPNPKISLFGKHLRSIFANYSYAKRMASYIIDATQPNLINDYLGLLPYFLFSRDQQIVSHMLTELPGLALSHPCVEIREILIQMMDRAELHVQNLA